MKEQLGHAQVVERLAARPGWHHRGNAIERSFDRGDFDGAMAFVNAVAAEANAMNHHPDITIRWGSVTLTLSSHDAGGLTDRDFALAERIDRLAAG
jgi:4a-hydroxytetrahydrobiopterin dehydratase